MLTHLTEMSIISAYCVTAEDTERRYILPLSRSLQMWSSDERVTGINAHRDVQVPEPPPRGAELVGRDRTGKGAVMRLLAVTQVTDCSSG